MNYREEIRKAIEDPRFGDRAYGKWGMLSLEQKELIKRLLDELDDADNCVKELYFKNQKQKEVIDKANKYLHTRGIKQWPNGTYYRGLDGLQVQVLEDILKEVSE